MMNKVLNIDTKATLGEKIRFYRERVGISQLHLEIDAEMPAGSVCRIERCMVNPSKETIFKIAKALRLTSLEVADLFEIHIEEYSFTHSLGDGKYRDSRLSSFSLRSKRQSERPDSNWRPLAPKASILAN